MISVADWIFKVPIAFGTVDPSVNFARLTLHGITQFASNSADMLVPSMIKSYLTGVTKIASIKKKPAIDLMTS